MAINGNFISDKVIIRDVVSKLLVFTIADFGFFLAEKHKGTRTTDDDHEMITELT